MRKIVQKNEVSIMKLSARRGLECRILHHLSQSFWAVKDGINLLATFQFSPATSKSIDIPGCADKLNCVTDRTKTICLLTKVGGDIIV
jgi:hypothetical protein